MTDTRERKALASNFLFKDLSAELLDRVASLGQTITFPTGEVVFRKGDPGDTLYSVLSGAVEITVDKPDGSRDVLNTVSAGDTFGEIAILDGMPRTADAMVTRETDLFLISRTAFMDFLRSESDFFEHVLRLLTERVRWVSDLIEQRNRAEAELRKLTSAVEHSPNVVLITDTSGRIEYVNPKFTELTGWEAFEAIGHRPSLLKSGQTPIETYRELWGNISAGREWRGDLLNRKRDGELYWENCCIAPIFDDEGALTNYVAVKEDMTERKRLEDELRQLATTDGLTGVANRRHFMNVAATEVLRTRRHGHSLAFMMMDIDFFKKINDTYGHGIGDEALKAVAGVLKSCFRPNDTVGRLGGEEFAVLLPETDREHAIAAAERLRQGVAAIVVNTELGPLSFTCSVGVGLYDHNDEQIDPVMQRADEALYEAKEGGRNRVIAA